MDHLLFAPDGQDARDVDDLTAKPLGVLAQA
jgi:hypothetical protein